VAKFELTDLVGGGHKMCCFNASYDEIAEVLGDSNIGASGDGKTTHEWCVADDNDNIYYIYDWKYYQRYDKDITITYTIGGNNIQGARELASLFA
jgi:hypothetical protein